MTQGSVAAEKLSEADRLRAEALHTELLHRDHMIGLEAQLAQSKAENDRLRARVDHFRSLAKTRGERLETTRASLVAARATAAEKTKAVADMRSSSTWRIGRLFVRPLGLFRRGGK